MDVCEDWQKEEKLARLLDEIGCEQGAKILVFVETKRKADELTRYVVTSYLSVNLMIFLTICQSHDVR